MDHVSLIHLSGPSRGETDELNYFPASVGSQPGSAVVVPGIAPRHALLTRRGGDVVLQDSGSSFGTFLAGEAVQEAVLRDGDVIELGLGGPRLRFRHQGAQPVSLVQALKWARPEGAPERLADTAAFFRAVVRESAVRTSRAFRAALLLVLALGAGLLAWTRWESRRLQQDIAGLQENLRQAEAERLSFAERVEEERRRSDAERRLLESRVEEYRTREEALRGKIAEAAGGEVGALRAELSATRDRLQTLESERAAGETIIKQYGAGVCLIQGSYGFRDNANRPLRVKVGESGEPERQEDGSFVLEVEGRGPPHTVDYYGTGFLVARKGLVLTNRHVAEPWWNDTQAEALRKHGFEPHFLRFRAFFPQEKAAFDLTLERRSERVDLALLRVNLGGRKVPTLPLERSKQGAVAGQPVVVVGYPAGLEAILAKAEPKVVKQILEAEGMEPERVTEALSRRGLIRPSTTQGHIGDVTSSDIVFDAPTTQGGSGGPVFNKAGQVIAVEYAVLSKFGGNSFGVPISYVFELLRTGPQKPGD
ncbi:MAG TPA: trypsin-like peptidase domain-containing protein [Vicinamibacteria bacterium]|nr:trypsin-like peptidase domain-containing protein [Vicinamibacteria bacterium]